MTVAQLTRQFATLPPEGQREALAFIELLRKRLAVPARPARVRKSPLDTDPFIGMWRDRRDLKESGKWVRALRAREWRS